MDFYRAVVLMVEKDTDTTRLGKWQWITYNSGLMGKLRIVVAYIPHKRTDPKSIGKVFQQQLLHSRMMGEHI